MQLIKHLLQMHRSAENACDDEAHRDCSCDITSGEIAVPTLIALVVTTRIFSSGESNQQLIQDRCDG